MTGVCPTVAGKKNMETMARIVMNMVMMIMMTMMMMEDHHHSSRQCNCKSTGCNSDFESAENIVCFKCNSADGIECDADHHGEEVKCWHPENRGCYIGESELGKK